MGVQKCALVEFRILVSLCSLVGISVRSEDVMSGNIERSESEQGKMTQPFLLQEGCARRRLRREFALDYARVERPAATQIEAVKAHSPTIATSRQRGSRR